MKTRRSMTRPVRKEITFSRSEWEQSHHLFEQVKGGQGHSTYMDFARSMLMYGSVHTVRVATDPAVLRAAINRIGNNINQIAHAANSTGSITTEEIGELKSGLARIQNLLVDLSDSYNKTVLEGWQR